VLQGGSPAVRSRGKACPTAALAFPICLLSQLLIHCLMSVIFIDYDVQERRKHGCAVSST